MAEIQDTDIDQRAKKPKAIFADGNKVEQIPIKDQIEAEQYAGAKRHAKAGGLPFRRIAMNLPGGV